MKKFFLYLIFFIFICFIMPILLTKKVKTVESQANVQESDIKTKENVEVNYDYSKYGTINLLHKKTGEVEQVKLDDYLYNVVSAEMPADYAIEALKAQAIVARTYTIYKCINKKHENSDICDDSTCCQAWISQEDRKLRWEESKREENWQKICDAVNSTKGKIITYNNKPIDAFFHSNSGGVTELPVNVWGGNEYPYLQSVETSGEDAYTQYSSEVILTKDEVYNKLKENYSDIEINFDNVEDIKILEYTEGTRVKTIKFGNHNLSGVEVRKIFGLKSTNFEIAIENNNIKFSVKGYGHGVGMSQTGADAMARQGKSAEEIITHFYSGVEIKEVNYIF